MTKVITAPAAMVKEVSSIVRVTGMWDHACNESGLDICVGRPLGKN